MTKRNEKRQLHQVNDILNRRYDCGYTLLELFLDHDAIHTLETLISYGPDETGGEDSETWQQYKALTQNFTIDLEASRFGAYSNFIDQAESLGMHGGKTFQLFSHACGYWGHDMSSYDTLNRGADMGRAFEERGQQYMIKQGFRKSA